MLEGIFAIQTGNFYPKSTSAVMKASNAGSPEKKARNLFYNLKQIRNEKHYAKKFTAYNLFSHY